MFSIPCVVLFAVLFVYGNAEKDEFQDNRRLAKLIVESMQDSSFDYELLFDLKKENQVYLNRTMSLLIKYIVKREVDNYRSRRTDAISRRLYSSLVMKLIDIAKDLPRNTSTISRIDTAHKYYMSVESKDMHDQMADVQVFHACARLYDIIFTYHLRNTVNFAISSKALDVLSTKPQAVGHQVIDMLKAIAARLLPVAELLDIHLAHSSPAKVALEVELDAVEQTSSDFDLQ
ncbi:unnamed protein product [Leptidea sinapis]|uniref:Uncharacterized protein n=1 Tax=Leptidea sinapis TaxID=189913 RepID=A0A5E4PMG9_9NEOP|nr:unnamed protein product [Leptidea sinapis]